MAEFKKTLTKVYCPFGYKLDKESNKFKIDSELSKYVVDIFNKRMEGESLRQIALYLDIEKVPTVRNGIWQANTIKKILENPEYCGHILYKNEFYRNTHEGIITEDFFLKVNGIRSLEDILYK